LNLSFTIVSLKQPRLSLYLAAAVLCISALTLCGWHFNIEFLKRPLPRLAAMNPVAAVCFISWTFAYYGLIHSEKGSKKAAARWLVCIPLLVGLLQLLEIVSGISLDIDRVLYADRLQSESQEDLPIGISAKTAISFVIGTFALLLSYSHRKSARVIANYMALCLGLIAMLSVLGYFYQVREFYDILRFVPMSVHGGISFIFLALIILFRNVDYGFMRELSSPHSGGVFARLLIPATIAVPLLLGYLLLTISWKYPISPEFGIALLLASIILIFFALIWYVAKKLNMPDELRKTAAAQIEKLNDELNVKVPVQSAELAGVFERITDGFIVFDKDLCFTYVNRRIGEIIGRDPRSLIGKNVWELFPEAVGSATYLAFEKARREQTYVCNVDYFAPLDLWQENHIYPSEGSLSVFVRDISEQKRAEKELKELNTSLAQKISERTLQLELANKELEAFSYSVSHDLRAPLRAVSGYARMLEEDYERVFDANGKRLLSTVQENAHQMGILIDNLLEFSRLGKREIQRAPVDMQSLVKTVVREMAGTSPHNAAISIGNLDPACGDGVLIRQVIINLIGNAIKYSARVKAPVVDISSVRKENFIMYSIQDNGIGFDMKYVSKLFGVFQRLHAKEDFQGTGVGLAMVKRMVEKHQGRVWAEGVSGKGSTFCFSLPAADSCTSNGSVNQ
jgi:PAS domain S-box-containing protein